MNSAKIEGGIVKNVAVGNADGYIECDSDVAIGWLYSEGIFTAPPQPEPEPPTVAEQIAELEASITPRNWRGAYLGDDYAIEKIRSVENQIKELRQAGQDG